TGRPTASAITRTGFGSAGPQRSTTAAQAKVKVAAAASTKLGRRKKTRRGPKRLATARFRAAISAGDGASSAAARARPSLSRSCSSSRFMCCLLQKFAEPLERSGLGHPHRAWSLADHGGHLFRGQARHHAELEHLLVGGAQAPERGAQRGG